MERALTREPAAVDGTVRRRVDHIPPKTNGTGPIRSASALTSIVYTTEPDKAAYRLQTTRRENHTLTPKAAAQGQSV